MARPPWLVADDLMAQMPLPAKRAAISDGLTLRPFHAMPPVGRVPLAHVGKGDIGGLGRGVGELSATAGGHAFILPGALAGFLGGVLNWPGRNLAHGCFGLGFTVHPPWQHCQPAP